jgi:hypothetical protein
MEIFPLLLLISEDICPLDAVQEEGGNSEADALFGSEDVNYCAAKGG